MTPESWNSSLLGNGVKQVPEEMSTHAKIRVEELPFLTIDEINKPL
jgi:hypothetical protein